MSPDDLTIIRYRLGKALDTLGTLQRIKGEVDATTVVSRAYYAAFYCVLGCLQHKHIAPRSHRSAMELFDREFTKPQIFERAISKALHELFERRQKDDYTRLEPTPAEDAALSLEQAQFFVGKIVEYFNGLGIKPIEFTERPNP